MKMTLKKVLSDLRSHPGRSLLVIFALIIGFWGIGTILVSYFILNNDLKQNFVRTHPAHVILTAKNFNQLDLVELKQREGIESAEFRDLAMLRIEIKPDEWIPLWLFALENFNNITLAQFYTEKGNSVPTPGSMLIERNGLLVSNLKLGTLSRVQAAHQIKQVPISGISFDPAQAPATQDRMIYAYVDQNTFTRISGKPLAQRLIVRFNDVNSTQQIRKRVDKLLDNFNATGITIDNITIPKLNEHPHQWQLNTLLFMQGSISLLAFLMGTVMVSQLMSSIMAKQVRQMGILKAMGAPRLIIFKMYLLMVLVLGISASVISVPLAVISAYGFSYFVAYQLNFDILTNNLPLYIYFSLITASLLLPIIMSLPAVLKGTNVSVKLALSNYGTAQNHTASTTILSSISILPRNLVMALRNSLRQKERLLISIITMALGVAIFSTGFNVRQSLEEMLANSKSSMRYDVQLVLNSQITRTRAREIFKAINNIKYIELWNGGRSSLQSNIISNREGVGIVALPYNSKLYKPRVIRGRWLKNSDSAEIVINQQASEFFENPEIGTYLALNIKGKTLKVRLVGIIRALSEAKIYIDLQQYDAFINPDRLVNSLMFVADDDQYHKVLKLKRNIEKVLSTSALDVLYVMSQAERVKIIYDHLNIILSIIVFLAFLVLCVSALGMASAMGINIMERTREIGILRAIGATPSRIYSLFVAEGMVVSITSVLLGLLLAWPLSIVATIFFGNLIFGDGAALLPAFSLQGFWITFATTLLVG